MKICQTVSSLFPIKSKGETTCLGHEKKEKVVKIKADSRLITKVKKYWWKM